MAATIRNFNISTIEITKIYKEAQFKEDLKILLKKAGKG